MAAFTKEAFVSAFRGAAAALAIFVIFCAACRAQEITRPIRIVVPFAPTGFPDRLGRILAKYLSVSLNQRVYVENKPGAGGILGSVDVAHGVPDGTSLLISSLPSQVITPLINANTGFDTFGSFTHIAYIGGPPNCFVSAVDGKFNTFDDLMKASRTTPQSYGSAGVGTLGNIFAEYVARKAGVKFIHVPYNGPMIADIISDTVDFGSLTMSTVVGNIQGGKLRALAVASDKRLSDFPDVPTFRELGFDISAVNWLALSGPSGMPKPLVQRINHDVIETLNKPEVRDILVQELIQPIPMTPDEVRDLMKSETERWAPIVAAAGLGK
jgi:tripartite-type tricarboxylate transporter receptor subunit TctC